MPTTRARKYRKASWRGSGEHPDIDVFERHFAVEIITQHHLGRIVTRRTPDITCYGAYILDEETGKVETFLSRVTLMATGGVGAVYTTTTNPLIATGDGIAMVYRAKAPVKGVEFIQFHPTALYHPGDRPSFLITEAVRGYGAVAPATLTALSSRTQVRPAPVSRPARHRGPRHRLGDEAQRNRPRLSRRYAQDAAETRRHFPNIYEKCLSLGIDITKDCIPVAPCAHYLCGGIDVDLNGESSIKRLYAVGECSRTGLHGGNRPASNSLIEAVVYADAAAAHAAKAVKGYELRSDVPEWNDSGTTHPEEMVLITQSVKWK